MAPVPRQPAPPVAGQSLLDAFARVSGRGGPLEEKPLPRKFDEPATAAPGSTVPGRGAPPRRSGRGEWEGARKSPHRSLIRSLHSFVAATEPVRRTPSWSRHWHRPRMSSSRARLDARAGGRIAGRDVWRKRAGVVNAAVVDGRRSCVENAPRGSRTSRPRSSGAAWRPRAALDGLAGAARRLVSFVEDRSVAETATYSGSRGDGEEAQDAKGWRAAAPTPTPERSPVDLR